MSIRIPQKILSIGILIMKWLRAPKYEWIYSRRFNGLTEKQIRYILERQYLRTFGSLPNLDNPKTLNEKIQWLKIHYHDPLLTQCADKVKVRDYIKEKIGEQYLVPVIGIFNSPNEIAFDKLPNQFVMKVNWGSGQNIICKDKSTFNRQKAIQQLLEWTKPISNHYFNFFEWCYKDIRPQILVEHYIEEFDGDLPDYKFFCYNGHVKNMFIAKNRNTGNQSLSFTFFDKNFNRIPVQQHYPTYQGHIDKPPQWEEMIFLAEKLSYLFVFARIDFYIINNTIKVGEITFNHFSGCQPFEPAIWDNRFGDLLDLTKLYPGVC